MQKQLLAALKRYPVFTVRDIAGVLGKKMNYAYLVAHRLKKAKAIYEIEKGKYSLEEDPFLVASWVVWPSYLSCWAALNYYKLTEQLPFTLQVVTTRKRKRKVISFANAKIEFIRVKKPAFFGFRRVLYRDKEIFVAEKEKALVDALATRKMTLGEALEIIRSNGRKLNKNKVFAHARLYRGLAKKIRGVLHD